MRLCLGCHIVETSGDINSSVIFLNCHLPRDHGFFSFCSHEPQGSIYDPANSEFRRPKMCKNSEFNENSPTKESKTKLKEIQLNFLNFAGLKHHLLQVFFFIVEPLEPPKQRILPVVWLIPLPTSFY